MPLRDRNYQREAALETPARKARRVDRKRARRHAIADGRVSVGDGKVVNHKKPLTKGGAGSDKNTNITSQRVSNKEGGKLLPRSARAKGGRH